MPPSNKTVTHAKGSFQRIVLTMLIKVMIAGGKPTYQSNCVVKECSLDIKNGPDGPTVWMVGSVLGPWARRPVSCCPLPVGELQLRAHNRGRRISIFEGQTQSFALNENDGRT